MLHARARRRTCSPTSSCCPSSSPTPGATVYVIHHYIYNYIIIDLYIYSSTLFIDSYALYQPRSTAPPLLPPVTETELRSPGRVRYGRAGAGAGGGGGEIDWSRYCPLQLPMPASCMSRLSMGNLAG